MKNRTRRILGEYVILFCEWAIIWHVIVFVIHRNWKGENRSYARARDAWRNGKTIHASLISSKESEEEANILRPYREGKRKCQHFSNVWTRDQWRSKALQQVVLCKFTIVLILLVNAWPVAMLSFASAKDGEAKLSSSRKRQVAKRQNVVASERTSYVVPEQLSCSVDNMQRTIFNFKVPKTSVRSLHICNLSILLKKIVTYLVGRKFHLHRLFCFSNWRKWLQK